MQNNHLGTVQIFKIWQRSLVNTKLINARLHYSWFDQVAVKVTQLWLWRQLPNLELVKVWMWSWRLQVQEVMWRISEPWSNSSLSQTLLLTRRNLPFAVILSVHPVQTDCGESRCDPPLPSLLAFMAGLLRCHWSEDDSHELKLTWTDWQVSDTPL